VIDVLTGHETRHKMMHWASFTAVRP